MPQFFMLDFFDMPHFRINIVSNASNDSKMGHFEEKHVIRFRSGKREKLREVQDADKK